MNNSGQRMEDVSRKARDGAYMIELHMLRLSNCMKAVRSRSYVGVISYSMKGGANLLKIGKWGLRNLGDYPEQAEENAMIVKLELKKQVCISLLVALRKDMIDSRFGCATKTCRDRVITFLGHLAWTGISITSSILSNGIWNK